MPIPAAPSSTVHQLARRVEKVLTQEAGCTDVRVSLLINPSREGILAPQALVSECFEPGDAVHVIADFDYTGRPAAVAIGQGRDQGHQTHAGPRIPITILTGFLGAGKTTLLNHLLHTQREQKIAVVENEFGAVPIDNELLAAKHSAAEQVVVMDNGCMCCSVRGDILGAFSSIIAAVESGKHLDAVLIETTGMADPVPIVRTLLQTPDISSRFRCNGVVTLADSKNLLARLQEIGENDEGEDRDELDAPPDEAFQQVMFADVIVMSKIDLVSTLGPCHAHAAAHKRTRNSAPHVPRIT